MKQFIHNISEISSINLNTKSANNISMTYCECEINIGRLIGIEHKTYSKPIICEMCQKIACYSCIDNKSNICGNCLGNIMKCPHNVNCIDYNVFCQFCHKIGCMLHLSRSVSGMRIVYDGRSTILCFCSDICKRNYCNNEIKSEI